MGETSRVLVCNCEKTMELDGAALGDALGVGALKVHTNLCRRDLSAFEREAVGEGELVIACTQEAPLFGEIIEEEGHLASPRFVNIRERAGWSTDEASTTPKIAALIQEALTNAEPPRLRTIQSDGLCLVYGRGQEALEAAKLLSSRLSVTLILTDASDVVLPQTLDFAIYKGRIKTVSGALGGFKVVVDDHAALVPSSRHEPSFIMAKDDVNSTCSLILDVSGDAPLMVGHEKRDGYVHVEPTDQAALMRAVFDLSDMVGEFEKPIYVDYDANICAHSRNQKTGCSNCLDVCPAGAITPNGENVEIDPLVCGGCGSCHSVCPTGAISYNYPTRQDMVTRLMTLSETYHKAGGAKPVLLVHDDGFGAPIIDAMARFSRGLPANTLPIAVHSPTVFGHTEMLAALVAGFGDIVFLCDPQKQDELTGLNHEIELVEAMLSGLELGGTVQCSTEPDPELLENLLYDLDVCERAPHSFVASGEKRSLARLAVAKLAEGSSVEGPISLPEQSPYGRVAMNLEACTLCMACVSTCPANALMDTPGEPKLRFVEQACVQCSLCVKTCPEKALTLEPQLDFSANAMQPITLKEEEPFECISCGKPFATKSTINRISDQLAGKHYMFADESRSELIKMCGDCRVEAQAEAGGDPFGGGERPRIRTTQDYIDSEEQGLSMEDFLIKH